MKYSTACSGFAALLLAVGSASAQWSENFDGYADGTLLDGVDGWAGWDNDSSQAGSVSSAQARSAPHSIVVGNGGSDAVRLFSGVATGQWTFTCYQYIPGNLDDNTFFIMNNEYNHGGGYDWAVQLTMDPFNGIVNDALRDPDGFDATPIVFDQWVEILVTFDLDNNTMENSYNGVVLGSGNDWNFWFGGAVELAAIDLYAPHVGTVYYDDLDLSPAGGGCIADCNEDGVVDTRDFLCYLGLWSAGDPAADLNGDGVVDTRDFLVYLGLWSAGC